MPLFLFSQIDPTTFKQAMVKTLNVKSLCICLFFSVACTGLVQAQEEKKQENPIGKFFRGLNKNVRDGAEEIQKAQQGRDQLDARPPQNPDFVRRLAQAKVFLKQQRWEDAVSVLQFLIEGNADSFYFDENLELRSLQAEVQRLLLELPPHAARNYLNRFEPVARRELQFARDFQDNSLLSRLANVFLKTSAGRSAATTYASNLYDQGHLKAASRLFEKVAHITDLPESSRRYASMAARAAAQSGDVQRLDQLVNDFDLPPEIKETQFTLKNDLVSRSDSTQLMTVETDVTAEIDPQFIPLWTKQSGDRYLIEEQIQQLYGDLAEANRAIILTSQCLIEQNLIAYHTLSGLEVRNATTGSLIWDNRTRQSVESAILNPAQSQFTAPVYRGRVPEQHPVVSLLLRDGISRSLTTDGRHLFVIENHELLANPSRGYSWQRRMMVDSIKNEKLISNEIVAYDFATGRVRWRLGGKVLEEPFTPPLAGTFFFGPPVSDGSDLYVIGERDEIISLFSINAQTGEILWSQEISHPSRGLAHDQVRRFWPCFPTIQDGVIICPTTCGWLVAVDQATHQLLWTSRYTPRKKSKKTRAFAIQSIQVLNRRWLTTPPVIIGDRILFTPPELPNEFNQEIMASFCFDLLSGSLLWQQAKGDGLYLAGIHDGKAIYVGQANIIAREIANEGEVVWQTALKDLPGKPSGRGVILEHELLVPIAGNTLIQVDLNSGKLTSTSRLESSEIQLGNLFYNNHKLFSVSSFHTSAFPIHKLSELHQRSVTKSFTSELITIEFLISNQKFTAALAAVQELRSLTVYQQATTEDRQTIEDLEWSCMEQLVLTDSDRAEEMLFSMQTLAETPREIARYQRLAANQELQAGHWKLAIQHLLKLLQNSSEDLFFTEGTRRVRADIWVGGQLRDIYESQSTEDQKSLEKRIQSELKTLEKSVSKHRLATLLGFLPVGEQAEMELAQTATSKRRSTEAILRLQRVVRSSDTKLATQAWLKMASLFVKSQAYSDARNCLENVLSLESVSTAENQNSHVVAKQLLQEIPTELPLLYPTEWGTTWEAFRVGAQGREGTLKSLKTHGLPFDFQKQNKFHYQDQNQRLFIEKELSGDYVWSLPLRSMVNVNHRSNVGVFQVGAVSYVVHRGALHALHTLDQRIAWTHLPKVSGTALRRLRSPSSRQSSVVNNLASFQNLNNLNGYSSPAGILLTANENCVLVIDEQIHALDPITGELLWSDTVANNGLTANVIGDQLLLCAKEKTEMRRTLDGQPVNMKFKPKFREECLQIIDGQYISLSRGEESYDPWILSKGTFQNPTIQDPLVTWELEIDSESLMVKFDEQTFLLVTPKGELSLIDLRDGSASPIGTIPGELMKIRKRLYAYADREFVFLAIAHGDGRTSYVNLPSLRASGTLICYSKAGEMLWSQNTVELANQHAVEKTEGKQDVGKKKETPEKKKTVWSMNLIVAELEDSPLLLFISDRPEHRKKVYFRRLTMVGLDKRTGEPVFDWKRISNSGGFSYLHIDVRDRYIDLRTYNERLKIQPVQKMKVGATEVAQ